MSCVTWSGLIYFNSDSAVLCAACLAVTFIHRRESKASRMCLGFGLPAAMKTRRIHTGEAPCVPASSHPVINHLLGTAVHVV